MTDPILEADRRGFLVNSITAGFALAVQPVVAQQKITTDSLELASDLKAPVLGLYGEADQGIPVDSVNKMREALMAAGKTGDLILYPEGPHGFHADYRPCHRQAMAEDGWKTLLEWFKKYGAA